MAKGLFQIASAKLPIGPGKPDNDVFQVCGRSNLLCDRLQVRISFDPKPDGSLPTEDQTRALERTIRAKISTDRNDTNMLTIGDIPVCAFQQLNGGPIPVQPFTLNKGDSSKIRALIHPNLLNQGPLKDWPGAYLEVLFYGQEA